MKSFVCPSCGSQLVETENGVFVCPSCGKKFMLKQQEISSNQVNKAQSSSSVTVHGIREGFIFKYENVRVYKDGVYVGEVGKEQTLVVPVENRETTLTFKVRNCTLEGKVQKDTDTHIFLWGDRYFHCLRGKKANDFNARQVEKNKNMFGLLSLLVFILIIALAFVPGVNILDFLCLIIILPIQFIFFRPTKKRHF